METDLEISQKIKLRPIREVAEDIGIPESELHPYGKYKAKVDLSFFRRVRDRKDGKLVLVTAMTPTPEGEGKTTISIGLSQALNRLGKSSVVALREPSLGPIYGMKGIGTGGGYSQVVPMEDINLHFTGDLSAVSAANNLLSTMLDNHIYRDNKLKIDPNRIIWKRCMDTCDRELRNIVVGVGEGTTGITRSEKFIISAASEIMAILCLSKDYTDIKKRLGSILVAYNFEGIPIYARDINAHTGMAVLLHEALLPNLVQTTEGTPAFVHGGPFANIAHGTSSLVATKMALKLSDIVVTEAGFGSDLGAEKFFDIPARIGGLNVDTAVIVASLRALRYHGGAKKKKMSEPNIKLMKAGIPNLLKHIDNLRKFNVEPVVALNIREEDTDEEIKILGNELSKRNIKFSPATAHAKGGAGAEKLGEIVLALLDDSHTECTPIYSLDLPIEKKIVTVAKEIYGLNNVVFTRKARKKVKKIESLGGKDIPICIAKTQYSLSNDPKVRGIPDPDTHCSITDVSFSAGAGFVVVFTESINLMPGLPRVPRVEKMDIDEKGWINGLG